MSYTLALEKAGATVLAYEAFGDYQGHWYAVVEYEGRRFMVSGYYGSCSGCDAFEGEFGDWDWDWSHRHADQYVDYASLDPACAECCSLARRLSAFGRAYLEDAADIAQLIRSADEASEWDLESKPAAEWLRRMQIQYAL